MQAGKADNLTAICELNVQNMWEHLGLHSLLQGQFHLFTFTMHKVGAEQENSRQVPQLSHAPWALRPRQHSLGGKQWRHAAGGYGTTLSGKMSSITVHPCTRTAIS
jgi:hypothetical protein